MRRFESCRPEILRFYFVFSMLYRFLSSCVSGPCDGAIRSINCLERVPDIWQGAVPIVAPADPSPMLFSVLANAVRLLSQEQKERLDDAVNVGGSGRPYEGLSKEQADAIRALHDFGFPRDMGLSEPTEMVSVGVFNQPVINRQDPAFWTDFWTKPGYAGQDDVRVRNDRIRVRAKVKRILTAAELSAYQPKIKVVDERGAGYRPDTPPRGPADKPAAVILDIDPALLSKLGCANIIVESGSAKGRERTISAVHGDALVIMGTDRDNLENVAPGDTILVDNSKFIAFCFYYRHQIFPEFREYRMLMKDGKPIYPQRPTH